MSYRFADSLRAGSGLNWLQAVSQPVWHITLLSVQWKTLDDGQRNCPKHVEFYSKNKLEKLVQKLALTSTTGGGRSVGIVRVRTKATEFSLVSASSWYLYKNLSRCTVWHIPLLCVQWKTRDDGQRNCPKHVEFYSKNKLEKLVHLFGFIVRICHDARSDTYHCYVYSEKLLMMDRETVRNM